MRKHTGSLDAGKDQKRLVVTVRVILRFALSENTLEYFFAVYLHFGWSINTYTYLIAFYTQHGDRDILPDNEFLPYPSC
jgi:hypothetical protein